LTSRVAIAQLTASCAPEGLGFAVDGNPETSWVCGPQTADQQIAIDLGQVVTVGAIVHALGALGADFPRQLAIETSTDGATWAPAWTGSPAGGVLFAALREPRATRLTLTFPARQARLIRLRQTGRDEKNYWSIAEVEVWGESSVK
jgi:hypothetical protein